MTPRHASRPARHSHLPGLAPAVAALPAALLLPQTAFAYIGPGAGLSAIGVVLALVATVALAVLGFVWYPVKRLMRGRAAKTDAAARVEPRQADDPAARPPRR